MSTKTETNIDNTFIDWEFVILCKQKYYWEKLLEIRKSPIHRLTCLSHPRTDFL